MNINWWTAEKYADSDQLSITDPTRGSKSMMDNGWGEIIGSWLEEDLRSRRKLRRAAKAIHEQLKPLGLPGSYRAVCVYIPRWKKQCYDETNYQTVDRLDHPIGEAQVDSGTMKVIREDHMKDIQLPIILFPYSNTTSVSTISAQDQECFLGTLRQLFNQCNGVPKTIRVDNSTPAMKKAESKFEEAQLTDEFLRFTIHYGCSVRVCNPRGGHKKGHVENRVGCARHNFFSASLIMDSFEPSNKQLEEQLKTDRRRTHCSRRQLIKDLWKKKNKALHSPPQEGYPIFKEMKAKLNHYHEMKLNQTVIRVPKAYGYSQLTVVLAWNKFKVLTPHGEILMNEYRPYMNRKGLIPWSGIMKQWSNKLNVVSYLKYWKCLPAHLQNYLTIDNNHLKYRRVKQLLSLLATCNI